MKLLLTALIAISAIAHAEGDARILFYQMTATVRVAITNDFCSIEEHKRTHPWAAYQFYVTPEQFNLTEHAAFAVGCYGPKDMKLNDIMFVWKDAVPFELPANAFLLTQDLYYQEVPKIPVIPDDGTRQDI